MREIKFRGWHVPKQVMFSAEEMATDQLTILPTGSFINVSGDSTRLSQIMPRDKFIPLQYTELRDKSGKEIYEGDIVRFGHFVWAVLFDEGSWALSPSQEVPDVDTVEFLYNYSGEILEVIGNIYENPELLEGEQ